jgi:lysozyme
MKLSPAGSEILILREGLRLKAYRDTKGILTIGVGHTGPEVVEGLVITKEKAHELFQKDVAWAEDAVNLVKVPLTQNQFDALVSFVFNIGAGAWKRSTMLKMLNVGDYIGASKQFDRWVIPIEITSRRMSEKAQFNS